MPLNENDWKAFLQELRSGQCCLLLGPEIDCLDSDGGQAHSVLSRFSEFIITLLEQENIPYKKDEKDFYYLANKYIATKYPGQESKFEKEIDAFREELSKLEPAFFQKIAQLPFNSIVNLVPDNFLAGQLTQLGYEFVEDYYDFTAKRTIDITNEMQLVYNLFGTYEKTHTVAVTEKQQLNLLKNLISGAPQIHDKITMRFSDIKNSFLFLGFDFNDWYFRLVMDALKIPKPNNFSYTPQKENSIAFLTDEFYSEKLGLKIIDQSTDEFIDELTNRYQQQYGDFNQKLKVVLDYHDDDKVQFNEFLRAMKISGFWARIDCWYKDLLLGGGIKNDIDNELTTAHVYIPFLSTSFLGDPAVKTRVINALNNSSQNVIPIYTNYCPYERALPVKKAKIILPRNGVPLSSKTAADLSQACNETVRIINCVVR